MGSLKAGREDFGGQLAAFYLTSPLVFECSPKPLTWTNDGSKLTGLAVGRGAQLFSFSVTKLNFGSSTMETLQVDFSTYTSIK